MFSSILHIYNGNPPNTQTNHYGLNGKNDFGKNCKIFLHNWVGEYADNSVKAKKVMSENTCLECSSRLKGRLDKKFCDDNCRSAYHNKNNRGDKEITKEINAVLRKNRLILKELYEKTKAESFEVDKITLLRKGFEFNYLTQIQPVFANQMANYCYEFGYRELNEGKIILIKIDKNPHSPMKYS